MNKNNFETKQLEKGVMHVYDFGEIRLHAYRTDDFLSDEVFIVEKNNQAVVIESPCFFDNNIALEKYVKDMNKDMNVAGMLVSYHGAGGTFLPNVRKYATENAKRYCEQGGGKALVDNFVNAFGPSFDGTLHKITDIIGEGEITIGGIKFVVTETADAYDVEIPQINAVYIHMLGHDCHSIVAGAAHADAIVAQLNDYIANNRSLILTSHYTPEDLKDAQTKIDYLKQLKAVASRCTSAQQFKAEVQGLYPEYSGENYLDMTASMFFA